MPAWWVEFWGLLSDWSPSDTWVCVTSMLTAMCCAAPGCYLLLRRQSMMGDALSHAVLPGIALAVLGASFMLRSEWIAPESYGLAWRTLVFVGAAATGVLTAVGSEWVRRLGGVESSAALGVVFTSLFALGLLLIRLFADGVHIDPDCVLFGQVETVALGFDGPPDAVFVSAGVLVVNLLLLVVFYKELKITSFDPGLATTMGFHARWVEYVLMAVTAATLVSAFETVGSILVVAVLIVPAASARMMTQRLSRMIALSLGFAALSALLGHVFAITLPPMLFQRLGYDGVRAASTAGMTAVTCGVLFALAVVFSPSQGLISRWRQQARLAARIAGEDVLGAMYRNEEPPEPAEAVQIDWLSQRLHWPKWRLTWAVWRLARKGDVRWDDGQVRLTEQGSRRAQVLVRSHRLWESYVEQHFQLPPERQHKLAHQLEHFVGVDCRDELSAELGAPEVDPHGRHIPPESTAGG